MPARSNASQRGLQQQPLLRVHRQGLARADAEEGGVEVGGVVEEPALAGVGRAGLVRVRVVEVVQVPAAVGRELADRVPGLGHQVATALPGRRRRRGSGRPSRRSRSARRWAAATTTGAGAVVSGDAEHLPGEEVGQRAGRGVVEDQGGGQPQAGGGVEAVAQLDRGERVEAQVLERRPASTAGCP